LDGDGVNDIFVKLNSISEDEDIVNLEIGEVVEDVVVDEEFVSGDEVVEKEIEDGNNFSWIWVVLIIVGIVGYLYWKRNRR